jgi:hypothetical protein
MSTSRRTPPITRPRAMPLRTRHLADVERTGEVERAAPAHQDGAHAGLSVEEGMMHEGALLGPTDMVQLLLDHGADVTPRSDDGETPLGTAASMAKIEMAAYLRARGGRL